jgi:hypothetical protein
MTTKLAIGLLLAAGLSVAAWVFRNALGLPGMAEAPPAAVRKCVTGSQVLYSSQACPAGSREQAAGGGTLTVLPAARVPTAADGASRPLPNVRDLLIDPQAVDIKERRIEAVTGR